MHGALLINKPSGISSFGVIETLQKLLRAHYGPRKRSELPKIGHGGTLDPFATGLLIVCVGNGVKLARYFLGSGKTYTGLMRFGETTVPGDPTEPVSEHMENIPQSLGVLNDWAEKLCRQPYLQTPPMHSAKKRNGVALYELAREGIEVDREAKSCTLKNFSFLNLQTGVGASHPIARADFSVECSSGTYIRTLAQDFGRLVGSVGMLDRLHRARSGVFDCNQALALPEISQAMDEGKTWSELPCWIDFNDLLSGYPKVMASALQRDALLRGQQKVLSDLLRPPAEDGSEHRALFCENTLIAVAKFENGSWGLERVFNS
jgi:tRNA pseudouridine55 synthase